MFRLDGRAALITGAGSGIGDAIARALAAQGARVALAGRREAPLRALAEELAPAAVATPCDLDDPAAATGLVARAEEALGAPLDVVVANAGGGRDALALRMSDDDWESCLRLNLGAPFRLARAALRGMMRRRWGRLIFIGSVSGLVGNAGQANYAAAKAGLSGLAKSLAREGAGRGITANVVAPGWIDTPMTRALSDEMRAFALAATPMSRLGEPSEIAAATAFLASSEASFITGATLVADGGLTMA